MYNYPAPELFILADHRNRNDQDIELIIRPDGTALYAQPSHQKALEWEAARIHGCTIETLINMCPERMKLDYNQWLMWLSGCICVWGDFFNGNPNQSQQDALMVLKNWGLYRGSVSHDVFEEARARNANQERVLDRTPNMTHEPSPLLHVEEMSFEEIVEQIKALPLRPSSFFDVRFRDPAFTAEAQAKHAQVIKIMKDSTKVNIPTTDDFRSLYPSGEHALRLPDEPTSQINDIIEQILDERRKKAAEHLDREMLKYLDNFVGSPSPIVMNVMKTRTHFDPAKHSTNTMYPNMTWNMPNIDDYLADKFNTVDPCPNPVTVTESLQGFFDKLREQGKDGEASGSSQHDTVYPDTNSIFILDSLPNSEDSDK